MNDIILVDENDKEIGSEEKMKAHKEGKLHRAFSIFIFNSKNELLLQKRASSKYHSPGLWTNTCCSHPKPGEDVLSAAHRRLKEEMGFDCKLKKIDSLVYKKSFPNGLTEHEYDHLIIGKSDITPKTNKDEADDFKWMALNKITDNIKANPKIYTYWFKITLPKVIKYLKK